MIGSDARRSGFVRRVSRCFLTPTSIERPGRQAQASGTDDIDTCDWIVVGHSHFDHLWGAERIMAQTDASLIGSYETVRPLSKPASLSTA
jgi:glyoxylase-like metal-dependent hydrolase (beta-lactamase superfamily II)